MYGRFLLKYFPVVSSDDQTILVHIFLFGDSTV